jgi:hypothetical protein
METNRDALKNEIIEVMKAQGFLVNPHLRPKTKEKADISPAEKYG